MFFDIGIIISTIYLFRVGFSKGIFKMLGKFLGVIGALILSYLYYIDLSEFLGKSNLANIISFLIIFYISNKVILLIFNILNKFFEIITIIPFSNTLSKILGGILGILISFGFWGVLLKLLETYQISSQISNQLDSSILNPFLLWIINLIFSIH